MSSGYQRTGTVTLADGSIAEIGHDGGSVAEAGESA